MHVHSTGHNAAQVVTQTGDFGTVAATAQSMGDGRGVRPADRVDLSPAAQAMLDGGGDSTGPGKSGLSPAHRARALIASQPELANMPFGMVVSGLVHGTLPLQPAVVETTTDQIAESTDPTTEPVGTDIMDVGTDSNSSDAVAGGIENTNTDDSQTTTTSDSTSPANGNESGTTVTDIVPPSPTIDTESMLLRL